MTLGSAGKARSAMRQVARASNTGVRSNVSATLARPFGLSPCVGSGLPSASETQATTLGSLTAAVCGTPNQDDCAAAGAATGINANTQPIVQDRSVIWAEADLICEPR